MRETNFRKIDLNLLIALNALLETKHVTQAAKRVHLSQPAMSRALARLRAMFQDPLLVKGQFGTSLTSRAQSLYQPLQSVLCEVSDMLTPPASVPAQMKGEIIIATRDYELATVLPAIIQQIMLQAPNIKITVVPLTGDDLSPLENQKVDFVIGGSKSNSATLHQMTLYEEDFICIAAKKNAAVKQQLTLEKYLQLKHCVVTIAGFSTGVIDNILAKKKLQREVTLRVPHFLAIPHIIAASDLLATLPARLATPLVQHNKLKILALPFKVPRFPIYLYWHKRNHHNPIHSWLKHIIKIYAV
jgi:DNA-binding transcriptional LysR family regulator